MVRGMHTIDSLKDTVFDKKKVDEAGGSGDGKLFGMKKLFLRKRRGVKPFIKC